MLGNTDWLLGNKTYQLNVYKLTDFYSIEPT